MKMDENLAHGYSSESAQRELPNLYQRDNVLLGFKIVCVLVLLTKIALALGGLNHVSTHGTNLPTRYAP